MAPIGTRQSTKDQGIALRSGNTTSQRIEEAVPKSSRRQSTSSPRQVSTMTLHRKTNKNQKVGRPSRSSAVRKPKSLTARRSNMVQGFLEMFNTNPQKYADYGSEDWIRSLIEHMKEPPHLAISHSDVMYWLETERIFEETNRIYGQGAVNNTIGSSDEVGDDVEFQLGPVDRSFTNDRKVQRDDMEQPAAEVQPYGQNDTTTAGAHVIVSPSFDELAEVIFEENATFMDNLAEPEVVPYNAGLLTPPH